MGNVGGAPTQRGFGLERRRNPSPGRNHARHRVGWWPDKSTRRGEGRKERRRPGGGAKTGARSPPRFLGGGAPPRSRVSPRPPFSRLRNASATPSSSMNPLPWPHLWSVVGHGACGWQKRGDCKKVGSCGEKSSRFVGTSLVIQKQARADAALRAHAGLVRPKVSGWRAGGGVSGVRGHTHDK